MKSEPAPSETVILQRLRQQLILSQVRIMELEDIRDKSSGRCTDAEKLTEAAQCLVDQKLEEAGHLAKVHDELQAQFEHMRHMQHVTNEALNLTRVQLASCAENRAQLQGDVVLLTSQNARLSNTVTDLNRQLTESNTISTARLEQINQLQGEIRTLKATRSWRWTGWLRTIGRTLSNRKS